MGFQIRLFRLLQGELLPLGQSRAPDRVFRTSGTHEVEAVEAAILMEHECCENYHDRIMSCADTEKPLFT